ncbi:MAG: hypothetical protein H6742_09485 [Alphaproteobacteria bacterium]|nr:hypothetical protein [Alphaproteobacteria bacterium]
MSAPVLLVGTRKGLLTFTREGDRWALSGEDFPGVEVEFACRDPRDGTLWGALHHGHWGPKLHRKRPGGEWEELTSPAYPDDTGAALEHLWVVQPGHADRPGQLWIGTNPGGLFRSDDGGDSWTLVRSLWDHPSREKWFGGGRDSAGIHSIVVDPRDPDHLYIAVSCAGVFETRDGGESWAPANQGVKAPFLPDPDAPFGQDPHFVAACAAAPDVLWQQNHIGVYRSTDGSGSWTPISQDDGPVGFGFPIAAHPQLPGTAWVVPATADTQRAASDRKVRVYRTDDGGQSWRPQTHGLPQAQAWDLVYRHALDVDGSGDGVAFGSTTGNLWTSDDGGEHWRCVGNHLPPVYSVRFG